MAVTSSFQYLVKGNVVYFTDTSTGAPSTYSWSFGDGTSSTEQNPVKRYVDTGVFNVSLTASKVGSTGNPYVQSIVVGSNESNASIKTRVLWDIPEAVINLRPAEWNTKINYYISYAFNLVGQQLGKQANSITNEASYNQLEGEFVAKIALYELFNSMAIRNMLATLKGDDTGTGPIKKITTGPADAEWFDAGVFYENIYKEGGVLDGYKQTICTDAAALGVNLSYCAIVHKPTTSFKVVRNGVKPRNYLRKRY